MMKKGGQAIVDLRRLRVSSLVLRQLTQREIVEVLPRYKILNPETNRPYSLGTVNSDVKYLKSEWREQAARNIAEHRSRVLAELQEVKREAWAQKDLRGVLGAIKQEITLLRLDQLPETGQIDAGLGELDFSSLDEADLDQLIANLETVLVNDERCVVK